MLDGGDVAQVRASAVRQIYAALQCAASFGQLVQAVLQCKAAETK